MIKKGTYILITGQSLTTTGPAWAWSSSSAILSIQKLDRSIYEVNINKILGMADY
jgi:hypothetical protein